MKRNRLYRIMMFLPLGILFIALFGFAVMSLWNWLMPELFGLKAIGYWQAMGLMVLSRIFFGGFGRGGSHGGHWRHRMMERWEKMRPEGRDRFRQSLRGRWGGWAPPDSTTSA